MSVNCHNRRVYKVVLTGGPCGGKTTGLDRLATFFTKLGWKVYQVPEMPTIVLSGGVKFDEVTSEQELQFQEDMLLALIRIEETYFHLADTCPKDCLVICDRGTMDPRAYIEQEKWEKILKKNQLHEVDLRDNRYNQVVHMVTAADGAQGFYSLTTNMARTETAEMAKERDKRTQQAWIGHPYVDVVTNNNCRSFDDKILRLIQVVCDRLGVNYSDRLEPDSRKRKWLVKRICEENFPPYQEFDVIHDYLHVLENNPNIQSRIRKRGQNGQWIYTSTIRQAVKDEYVETRRHLSKREYEALRVQRDSNRISLYKKRRCFMVDYQYYQLDIYVPPLPPQSPDQHQLVILETYTTQKGDIPLPSCLEIEKEISGDRIYSMFNLALFHKYD